MSSFKDRRSAAPSESSETAAAAEAVMAAAKAPDESGREVVARLAVPRRVAPGARTFSEFFAPDKQQREIRRGEFLNLLSMLEYQRYEALWWRRLWRYLTHQPQIRSFLPVMREAHARTLEDAKQRLLVQAAVLEQQLADAKAKHSRDVEGHPHA